MILSVSPNVVLQQTSQWALRMCREFGRRRRSFSHIGTLHASLQSLRRQHPLFFLQSLHRFDGQSIAAADHSLACGAASSHGGLDSCIGPKPTQRALVEGTQVL